MPFAASTVAGFCHVGSGPGVVTLFFLSCPSRHEPPRKPPLDTHLTPSTQQLGQQVGWQPPAAMHATGLRATRSASTGWALRARAPAASLRTSHVPRATARRAAAHLAGSGAAGGCVEAEREGA
eukprot:scaffold74983_cov27-Phaeocystis_antarctica.AAC.1